VSAFVSAHLRLNDRVWRFVLHAPLHLGLELPSRILRS
jgi:hypothetical protein